MCRCTIVHFIPEIRHRRFVGMNVMLFSGQYGCLGSLCAVGRGGLGLFSSRLSIDYLGRKLRIFSGVYLKGRRKKTVTGVSVPSEFH